MNFALKLVLESILVPAGATTGVYFAWQYLARLARSDDSVSRYRLPLAVAFGIIAGHLLLPAQVAILPARHWHWLGYLALLAGTIGPLALASSLHRVEQGILLALGSLFAAWVLVPHWASLTPPRNASVPLMTCYLLVLTLGIQVLSKRTSPRMQVGCLLLAHLGVAAAIGVLFSITYASVAMFGAAAWAVIWGALFLRAAPGNGVPAAALLYSVTAGGWAYVGGAEPQPNLYALLAIPFAPCALFAFTYSPLRRLTGLVAILCQVGLVVMAIGLVALWLWLTQAPSGIQANSEWAMCGLNIRRL